MDICYYLLLESISRSLLNFISHHLYIMSLDIIFLFSEISKSFSPCVHELLEFMPENLLLNSKIKRLRGKT